MLSQINLRITVLCTLVVAFSFLGCSKTADPVSNATNTRAADPKPASTAKDEVAEARDLYTVNCMTCHRDSGKGGKVTVDGRALDPDDLTTEKMKAKTDEKLLAYVADGVPDEGMPAFKDKLTADQMKLVVKHVRTLQGK